MKKYLIIIFSLLLCFTIVTAQTRSKGKTAAKSKTTKTANTKKSQKTKGSSKSVTDLQKEQQRIKSEIEKQKKALKANKDAVRQKLKNLASINSDVQQRQQAIDSINSDIYHLDNNIGILSSQIDVLNQQLEERKASYIKSMRYMARQRGIQNQLMFIFSAKNFSQIVRRLRFVRQYAAFQRAQGKAVQEKQQQIDSKRSQLHTVRGEKSTLLYKGTQEQNALKAKKDEEQKLVNELQSQQKTIEAVIEEQKKLDAAINAKIEQLIAQEMEMARQRAAAEAQKQKEKAEEAKRKAAELAKRKAEAEARQRENAQRVAAAKAAEEKAKAEARAAAAAAKDAAEKERAEQMAREAEAARVAAERKAEAEKARAEKAVAEAKKANDEAVKLSSADRLVNGGFEANKGRLPSPLPGGRIVSHYGQHSVEGLKGVVLDNKGINIQGSQGAQACAVYDGEVSAVFDISGSKGVLVRHGAYISVYCNLKSAFVAKGQKVKARQAIGVVGTDNILQFQLRKERNKLNPEQWIAR